MLTEIVLALVALFGHAVVWVGLNNRLHAMRLKRSLLKTLSALSHFGLVAIPVVFAWWIYRERPQFGRWHWVVERNTTALFYILFCLGMAAIHLPRWLFIRFLKLRRAAKQGRRLFMLDIAERLGRYPTRGWKFAMGRYIPFNQIMRVEFSEKEVPIPDLPRAFEGLRIVHFSDLHLSGRVEPAFFIEALREVNALKPDLVLLTGDVFDRSFCVPWIGEMLSPLQARHGKFFILGNHDDRLRDIPAARAAIAASGFVDLGGRLHRISIDDSELWLAGDERPWFGPGPLDKFPSDEAHQNNPLKILLSHSPDQLRWAKKRDYKLMLCGHTHGGQICFPVIGPIVCPSWYGVRYASGLFCEGSLAVHVTRGVSGLFPLRWNCLPEIAVLVLRNQPPSKDS